MSINIVLSYLMWGPLKQRFDKTSPGVSSFLESERFCTESIAHHILYRNHWFLELNWSTVVLLFNGGVSSTPWNCTNKRHEWAWGGQLLGDHTKSRIGVRVNLLWAALASKVSVNRADQRLLNAVLLQQIQQFLLNTVVHDWPNVFLSFVGWPSF